ncbi:hypothetical protein ACOT7R_14155 [Clostridium perfringens]|uniref:hypothetical protein n=1 Tax=Clostridium perfringens TaxID=1502 RepID=UPI003BACACA3
MTKAKNLIGNKIGLLTVLDKKSEKINGTSRVYYLCKCECGNKKWIRSDALKSGRTTSCGCKNEKNIIGKKFGKLTVIKLEKSSKGRKKYLCECMCGNKKIVSKSDLITGHVKSCGCLLREKRAENGKKILNDLHKKYLIDGTYVCQLERKKPIRTNTSGTTGVTFEKKKEKWRAFLEFKGKRYNLGSFDDKESAIKARKEAEEKIVKPFLENLKGEK